MEELAIKIEHVSLIKTLRLAGITIIWSLIFVVFLMLKEHQDLSVKKIHVDAAVPQYDMDKLTACKKLGASILFVGDDWYATEKWQAYEEQFRKEGIRIVYFPYTKGISSTKITQALHEARGWSTDTAQKLMEEGKENG